MKIKLIKSSFYKEKETKEKLIDFIRNAEILSMNEQCKKFEQEFADKQERKYALLVSSGSAANLLIIQSLLNLGLLKKGDKVGISALTWATNVMPLIQLGLKPIIIDCELETLNVSKKMIEQRNENIKCLFLTNALGLCSDIYNIEDYCKKNNILLLEDNCESLGTEISGKKLGNFGLASSFSFYIGHHLSTIEGGMICTDDKIFYEMLILIRAHGWDRNLEEEPKKLLKEKYKISDFLSKYSFYDLAYNLRPTEITGFLGNEQLKYLDEIIARRAENFKKFSEAIKSNKDLIQLNTERIEKVSNFAFPLVFKNKELFEKYRKKFEDAEIEIRPIIAGNIQNQPFYKKYISEFFESKNADFIQENGFYFGNNPEMSDEEINFLCALIKNE